MFFDTEGTGMTADDFAGKLHKHGVLVTTSGRYRGVACESRRGLSVMSVFAVEESELAEATGESEVRIAEDLGLLHRVEIPPLGIGDLAAVPGALGGGELPFPPRRLSGGGDGPEQEKKSERSRDHLDATLGTGATRVKARASGLRPLGRVREGLGCMPSIGCRLGASGGEPMSEDLMTKVQELIDSSINPAVAGHGGFVQLVDVKENKVYLQMGGGCQGCGAADVTLKAGIERLIKEECRRSKKCWTRRTTPPAPTVLHARKVAQALRRIPHLPSPHWGRGFVFDPVASERFRSQSHSRTPRSTASTIA